MNKSRLARRLGKIVKKEKTTTNNKQEKRKTTMRFVVLMIKSIRLSASLSLKVEALFLKMALVFLGLHCRSTARPNIGMNYSTC